MDIPKILVIEDDFTSGENLSTMLVRPDLSVTIEDDIVEAVQRLRAGHWDLVVADTELLGNDGMVLLEMARELTETLFLLISGEHAAENRLAAERVGAAAVLNRPVDPRELQGLARELIATGRAVDAHARLFQ
jgi:DNA-binding response OmpR family regulator